MNWHYFRVEPKKKHVVHLLNKNVGISFINGRRQVNKSKTFFDPVNNK